MAAVVDDTAYIIVRVRATFKISPAFKQFCVAMMESGVKCLVLDMQDCSGMDSTFMGVVAGLANRLRRQDGTVMMINLSPHLRGLIETLGLDHLVEAYNQGCGQISMDEMLSSCHPVPMDIKLASDDVNAETMLDAHETLVRLLPENEEKFRDVLHYLREELVTSRANRGQTGASDS